VPPGLPPFPSALTTTSRAPASMASGRDPEDNPKPGAYGASEMAGPRWSPDGSRLFINVQYPGVTCVIEGLWNKLR